MNDLPDWEERCALALAEIERTELNDADKIDRVRRILQGDVDADDERAHCWVEVGMDSIAGTEFVSPGNAIHYRCQHCNAFGYRIVFPTSVTLYPIVSDAVSCKP